MEIDYQQLAQRLNRVDAQSSAAESHGLLAGLLCALGSVDPDDWLEQVYGEMPDPANVSFKEANQSLAELYQHTIEQINDSNFRFELFLPDEESQLSSRLVALKEWCEGFLLGFASRGQMPLPEEVDEVVHDLVEITRVDLLPEGEAEENETAFAEIVEYVRMGVVFILEEMQPLKASPTLH